ncbi:MULTISPECIES: isochorismatase family protein [Kluyvera]|uniref:isochorismatase family protein n=1 Tax=Kluyvera sp. CHPC 1.2972 TaxID=2995176 RepID=UPI002FD83EF5
MDNRGKEFFTIDRDDVVFIFVDLQEGLIQKSKTMEPDALSSNAAGLAQVAHAISAPALFFTVPQEAKEGEPLPTLQGYANDSNTFYRVIADPFLVNAITSALDNLTRSTLFVCGYTAEVGVLLTALGGLRQGYNVFIPVDCVGSRSLRTEMAALRQAEKAGAVITSLATLAAQLAPDFSKEPGRTMLSVISNIKC